MYRCGADGVPEFVEVDSHTDDEVHALLQTLVARQMKLLTRRGVLVEDMGQTYLAEPDADADAEEARTLEFMQRLTALVPAPHPVSRRAGSEREAAPAGGAAETRTARADHQSRSCQ